MKITKELNLSFVETITEKQVYLAGDLLFLAGHLIYLALFHYLGVIEMERYNYFSVGFYTAMLYFISHSKNRNSFILVVLWEIILHSCLCTYFMGWTTGFAQFLLVIIPIPFYQPLKAKSLPYIISAIDILIFAGMKIGNTSRVPIYEFDSFSTNLVYFVNSFFSFIIIVYVSSIYLFSREFTQRRLSAQNESLQRLATIDPLTKLFNRRAMEDYMRLIQKSSSETGKTFVVGLGDIDDFKKVNDSFGHGAGDEVLRTISNIMVTTVPTEGYVCRWGGEELLFVVPQSSTADGEEIAKKICTKLEDKKFKANEKSFVTTITFGICEIEAGGDYEKAIHIADKRLYQGKNIGKNCVITDDN